MALASVAAAVVSAAGLPAHGASRFATEPPDAEQSRAYRYAALASETCLATLKKRGVPFKRVDPTRGVDTPVRLSGALRGVRFRPIAQLRSDEEDDRTIADCRLVLALDDLARALRRHSVVEVEYYSIYRRRGAGWVKPGMRHQGARAMDLVSVKLSNGTLISVRGDFHGGIGQTTCGEKATKPRKDTPGARLWRSVVCEMHRLRSFNLILTPNHDWAHRDHLHMEVRSGIKWFLIH
jgi:hypothetical protein